MSRNVPSILKAIRVLDLLADNFPNALQLKEIDTALGLPPSTALGICVTLSEAEMIARDARGLYSLGPHTVTLARAYLSGRNPVDNLTEALMLVPELRTETVIVGVLQGVDVVYVACRTGMRPIAIQYQIGMRLPAHCSACGKAALSLLPESQVVERFHNEDLLVRSTGQKRALKDLIDELEVIRQRGYAFDNEEVAPGMVCYGAPICDMEGRPIAAVGVSCVKAAVGDDDHSAYAEAVMRLAKYLSGAH